MGLMLNNQPIKGEVHLGKQTIGKMYYNHELVYENMLASGTVIWEGDTDVSKKDTSNYKNNYIKLEKINNDWSNLAGLEINWYLDPNPQTTYSATVKREDLRNHSFVGVNDGIELGNWSENSNVLYFKVSYMHDCHITKITAL